METFSDRVTLEIDNQIALVTLNRPLQHNALDLPMFDGIKQVIDSLSKRKSVRVVIVSGAGKSFCSGLDVKSVLTQKTGAFKLLWKWLPGSANRAQWVSVGWRRLKVPVIMAIHGNCWGGGMQIALGGDFRIAQPDASLAIMESKWGLIPDMGGTLALIENLKVDDAMRLAMTSETISADEALKIGLISQVDNDPINAARELAAKLIERSPDVLKAIKPFYHSAWCRRTRKVLAQETLNQIKILMGKNRAIAVKKARGDHSVEYR